MLKNIEPVEHLGQVYEAFDTLAEDDAELFITTMDLLKECGDDRETKNIVLEEADKDRSLLRQREKYVLSSLFRVANLDGQSMRLAALEYTSKHDDPENVEKAAKRVSHYNQIIERNITNGAPIRMPLKALERSKPIDNGSSRVRIHGRTDPETGQTWYDITNPRTVEYIDKSDEPQIVMSYEVVERSEKDGEITILARQPSSNEASIKATFSKGSRVWRLSEDGTKLGLIIPSNSESLVEAGLLEHLYALIDSNDEASKVAVNATGANVPNIIESFEHPDGVNPVPLSNPKRN